MGVGVAQDSEGKLHTIIGTSEPRGYLRPGVTLNDGEIMAVGTGHAEVDILNHAQSNGWTLLGVGATPGRDHTVQKPNNNELKIIFKALKFIYNSNLSCFLFIKHSIWFYFDLMLRHLTKYAPALGATRPACPNCQDALDTANVPIFTPRK